MKRHIRLGAVLAVVTAVGAFGAVSATAHVRASVQTHPAAAHPAATTVKLGLEKTKFGSILVIGGDRVVYSFTKGNSVSDCVGTCASVWPPLLASKAIAGPGVNAKLLGTVARGGKRQVTYKGQLLYLYADGKASYDVAYIGVNQFGGVWDGVKANGVSVR
jgi:predicted lipoprotein with Yx(FWY)xxD motif